MIRELAWSTAARTGLPWFFRRHHRQKVLILMYHAVVDGPRPYTRWTHLDLKSFKWQIRHLKKRFQILPLSETVERMRTGRPLPANTAVITFDDGFRNNYTTAFPVLRAEGVPATIMLTTGYLDTGVPNWPDRLFLAVRGASAGELDLERFGLGRPRFDSVATRDATVDLVRGRAKQLPAAEKNELLTVVHEQVAASGHAEPEFAADFAPLSWDEVGQMAASGLVEFGAHSVNHEILSKLPRDAARREITASCDVLRGRLGLDRVTFAYPNGARADFDDHCKAVLREAGALCGLSTVEGLCGPGDDLYELKRIGVGSDMTPARFSVMCSGLLSSLKASLGQS